MTKTRKSRIGLLVALVVPFVLLGLGFHGLDVVAGGSQRRGGPPGAGHYLAGSDPR